MPYIDPSIVDQVKQIDLLSYLRDNEPGELVKLTSNTYATKTYDSLKISNGKWYWWSRGFGGRSALDYLIKVRDMTFLDAVEHLANRNTAPLRSPTSAALKSQTPKSLTLPRKSRSNDRAYEYLKSRGINEEVINECMRLGFVYESIHGNLANVAFLGFDTRGTPKYAAIRGIQGNYKGEAAGSDKHFPFKLQAGRENTSVYVFESAIDIMSYASILALNGTDWRGENLLSLGGIPPKSVDPAKTSIPRAIVQYLNDNPHTQTMYLMLDNDEPGRFAANKIATVLYSQLSVHIFPPPQGKDYNDYLRALRQRECDSDSISTSDTPSRPSKKTLPKERSRSV